MSENQFSLPNPENIPDAVHTSRWTLAYAAISVVCLLVGAAYVYYVIIGDDSIKRIFQRGPGEQDSDFIIKTIVVMTEKLLPLLIVTVFTIMFAHASIFTVKAKGYNNTGVVPSRDLELIKVAIMEGKSEPIDQYIRLASLAGGVGLFQKIGLTGLPLATLALVVFFTSGIMLFGGESKTGQAFLDFTKLTLGAFIGSFVQRQVERRGQEIEIKKAIESAATAAQSNVNTITSAQGGVTLAP